VSFCSAVPTPPLCDRHHVPMVFASCEDLAIADAGYVYFCWQSECGRYYDPALGYFDFVDGAKLISEAHFTCPSHAIALYEGHYDFMTEIAQLRCPSAWCLHTSIFSFHAPTA